MGRLINEKDLIELYDENDRLWWGSALDDIQNLPTVEAIPKDQYEARLKADIVAILKEIQTEIEEAVKEEELIDKKWANGLHYSEKIIQQKIITLKSESEEYINFADDLIPIMNEEESESEE